MRGGAVWGSEPSSQIRGALVITVPSSPAPSCFVAMILTGSLSRTPQKQ